MKRYHLGTREAAMAYMLQCAIRDREAMIDSLTPQRYLGVPRPDAAKYIQECKDAIADFKRLAGVKP